MGTSAAVDSIWESASADVLDQLYSFGEILLNEVQQRSAQLDTKLTTMLGLSGAMMAFLLIGNEFWSTASGSSAVIPGLVWYRLGVALASAIGLACIVLCYFGLKLRQWDFPSTTDWLNREYLTKADEMKRFHIISMLETHDSHNKNNAKKARNARRAENLLAISAALVGLILLARVVQQLATAMS
jgi:hypothetical protein